MIRIFALTAFFAVGSLEAFVLKLRYTACVTWMTGLLALMFWIMYPFSAIRLCLGTIVFTVGLALIVSYYKITESQKSI
jgi:hypothetical protein